MVDDNDDDVDDDDDGDDNKDNNNNINNNNKIYDKISNLKLENYIKKKNKLKKKKKKKKKKNDPLIIPVLCTSPRSIATPPLGRDLEKNFCRLVGVNFF